MEPKFGNQVDSTLVKLVLGSVKEGDLTQIKNNIAKYSLDVKMLKDPQHDQNVFFFAALIKDDNDAINIFKYFKEMGVDPLAKDKLQQTSLYYTAREGKYLSSQFLIDECGLPLNDKDIYGQTPLYYAAREGRLNLVQLFVEREADVNIEDKYGQHCLFYAIREGHYEVVSFLIEKGADVNKADKKKITPLAFAEKYGKLKIAELLSANGAKQPEGKHNKDKKMKKHQTKKTTDTDINKQEQDQQDDITKHKKFILIKVLESGDKVPLTPTEIAAFKEQYPDIALLLDNHDQLEKEVKEADEELKQYDSWEKQAKKLITSLWKFKDSEIFHKPVDPMELGIPDYFDIIENPMDFTTIKKKLNNFHYTNFSEFCKDMNLVFDNCILYNGERSVVGAICINVKNEYKRLFEQLGMRKFL